MDVYVMLSEYVDTILHGIDGNIVSHVFNRGVRRITLHVRITTFKKILGNCFQSSILNHIKKQCCNIPISVLSTTRVTFAIVAARVQGYSVDMFLFHCCFYIPQLQTSRRKIHISVQLHYKHTCCKKSLQL